MRISHIHWLLPSAASDTDLMVCLRACPWIFRSVSSLMVEEATNALLSISIRQNLVLKPGCFTLLRNFFSSLGLLLDCELLSYMQSYIHHRPLCGMKKISAMVSPPDRDFSELSPGKQPPSLPVTESDSVQLNDNYVI